MIKVSFLVTMASLLTAPAAFASDATHTFTMPVDTSISEFLNLDGPGFPVMDLLEFCKLNEIKNNKCLPEMIIKASTLTKFRT
jgi:hypothetical protein